ncbi:MAG: FAD-dependent oxidoreductase [Bacteroidales bacterium]
MKYLIIGGVAGGATTAARLRRIDENSEIILFEKGDYISYANCGLPYYIGNVIKERGNLFLQTPISFGNRFNVEVRIKSEVIHIDSVQKKVKVCHLDTGKEYEEYYDKLVLSPGAEPIKPPIAGIDSPQIFTLRSVNDTDRIKKLVQSQFNTSKETIIVGAGFIGLEMAENLHQLGFHITIIEKAPQVMTPLDLPMAVIVHDHLKNKNINLILNNGVSSFSHQHEQVTAHLENGESILGDLVILSIGVKPDIQLAKTSGLKIGNAGGIWVNEHLQTSEPDIYAVGDAIEFPHPVSGKSFCCYLAGPANKQARICADNLVNENQKSYQGSIATAIAKVFDLTVGATGLSEMNLKGCHIPYLTSITHPTSHAGYYPGAKPMSIKLNFAPANGKLLGAQVVGSEGADKRLDLLASVISNGGTIYDLIDLEHAYAPPYSSAKDPVSLAGYVAENILTQKVFPMQWDELESILSDKQKRNDYFMIDTRTVMEYKNGTISGSSNYPVDEIREWIEEIPSEKKIILFCAVGLRGYIASRILLQSGFKTVYNLSGGFKTYSLLGKYVIK